MPPDTSVHFFHSGLPGAPVLNNTAGSLIAVLDACLVNGFGTGTADGVTISGGIATLTRGAGHSAEVGSVMLISGATTTGGSINGEQRVLTVASDRYTFDATGIPNQTATGTITQRLAPAGWAKAFSGTNLAAYRAPDVTGTRFYLRVDDSGTQDARVRGYETMTDVNTGTGLFPSTVAQAGSGYFWAKSFNATASQWVVVADGKTVYLASNYYASSFSAYSFYGAFGDVAKAGSADQFACVLAGSNSSRVSTAPGTDTSDIDYTPASNTSVSWARAHHGIGAFVSGSFAFASPINLGSATRRSGAAANSHIAFPNPSDGGVYMSPVTAFEWSSQCLRGALPGVFAFPQAIGPGVFASGGYLTGVSGYPGKTFRLFNTGSGVWAFDMSGPWQ